MKLFSDQGKVDTRSGFGALGLGLILFALVVVASCGYDLFENEPEDRTPIFQYYYEYVFDNEFFCDTTYVGYKRFDYQHFAFPLFLPRFYGVKYSRNESLAMEGVHKIDYSDLDFNQLCFEVNLYYNHLTDDFQIIDRQYVRFRFGGDGSGPFHEGVEYSWPDGFISDPEDFPPKRNNNVHINTEKWRGATFKALSSSFKFKYRAIEDKCIYREIEDEYVRDVLDVFFDFELVIVGVPESWGAETYPNVGDTIRVKNGHFVQSLFCYDTDFLHQLIVPNEENN